MRVLVIFLLIFAISFAVAYSNRKADKPKQQETIKEERTGPSDAQNSDQSLEELDAKEFEKAEGEQEDTPRKKPNVVKSSRKQQEEDEEDEAIASRRIEDMGEKMCQKLKDPAICAKIEETKTRGKNPKPPKSRGRNPVEEEEEEEKKEEQEDVEYVCDEKQDGMCLCQSEELDCRGHIDDTFKLETTDIIVNKKIKNFKIKVADFSQNRIRHLKKNRVLRDREEDVAKLDFEHNLINRIEAGVFEPFKGLLTLKLGHNRISKLDKSHLSGLTGLHQLWLNENLLKKLDNGTFKELKNLKKLILDGNKIPIRKELFEGLDSLEELSLDDCGIKLDTLDANVFDHLKELKVLSMRKNPLEEVPKALKVLEKLERLDLSETFIVELHERSFDKDSNLKYIRIANSSLFSIQEKAFYGLDFLEEIDMSNNAQLCEIHPNAFGMDSGSDAIPTLVQKINFSNCNLTELTEDTFYMNSLKELSIGGNPWVCNCDTKFLLGDTFDEYTFLMPTPKCHFPEALKGQKFTQVDPTIACPAMRKTRAVFRGVKVLTVLLLLTTLCIASFMVYQKGYIQNFLKTARNGAPAFPSMTYSNLNNTTDDGRTLETDFQPRPEDV